MEPTRTNAEIADVFERIAEILEGQGENPFKIRAYRNAVRTLETLDEPAAAIEARGELKKIPGFGEAIVGEDTRDFADGNLRAVRAPQSRRSRESRNCPCPQPRTPPPKA